MYKIRLSVRPQIMVGGCGFSEFVDGECDSVAFRESSFSEGGQELAIKMQEVDIHYSTRGLAS